MADTVAVERAQQFGSRQAHRAELASLDTHRLRASQSAKDRHWLQARGSADKPGLDDIDDGSDRRVHILDGDERGGGHRHGSRRPGKTTFPASWSDDKIMAMITDVARNPDQPPVYQPRQKTWLARGHRDGVDVTVAIEPSGRIVTGYPNRGDGVHKIDKHGVPQLRPLTSNEE